MPPVQPRDLGAVFTAGTYAMSMSSTNNDHPLPAEFPVDGDSAREIRPGQHHAELLAAIG